MLDRFGRASVPEVGSTCTGNRVGKFDKDNTSDLSDDGLHI